MWKVIVYLYLVLFALPVFAQKEKTVEGEFVYPVPETESLASAKKHALKVARLLALAEGFGTVVAQTNLTRIQNNNGLSSMQFSSFGSSDVKGEWIENIGKPEYKIFLEDEALFVRCKVKGKAREILFSQVEFQAKVLRNGTDDRYEDDNFLSGNNLYLSFKTPKKGYLAVYLADENDHAWCLIPYMNQQEGVYQVEANRRYVFFSRKDDPHDYVHPCALSTDRSSETNQIYVIFSPNQFAKAVDSASNKEIKGGIGGYPRELSYDDFHKWLAKCRRRDKDMCFQKIVVTVQR